MEVVLSPEQSTQSGVVHSFSVLFVAPKDTFWLVCFVGVLEALVVPDIFVFRNEKLFSKIK